jgi:hypothetical protein
MAPVQILALPVRVIALLFTAVSLQCAAAPFAVQLGDARVGLDAPPGFADTGFTGSPRLQELAESLTSASNKILLFALTDADLRRFMVGDSPEFRRHMMAVTPKGLERDRLTESTFARFVDDALREFGAVPKDGEFVKFLNTKAPGQVALLGRTPDVVSVLQGTRLPALSGKPTDPSRYLLSSTTLMLIRGKAINLSAFTAYEQPADLEWLRATTARWIEDIQRLNGR